NFFRKYILGSAAASALMPGFATPAAESPQAQTQVAVEEVTAVVSGENSVAVESPAVPSETTNTIETSEIARKMTQAEKAQNAAENDSWGGAITIIAMCIVIAALIILSILFMGFGKISQMLLSRKKLEAHGLSPEDVGEDHVHVDSGDVIAAIAMALAEHFDSTHDLEDTILTIRRMRKAYSPWNSKIYNMRPTPELRGHKPVGSALRTPSREA
ncbi:MAG: OadG family protein, partial [Muribaculaceae bacterium]|nr:OadG family protein [Muribaculaceae bacterium]